MPNKQEGRELKKSNAKQGSITSVGTGEIVLGSRKRTRNFEKEPLLNEIIRSSSDEDLEGRSEIGSIKGHRKNID